MFASMDGGTGGRVKASIIRKLLALLALCVLGLAMPAVAEAANNQCRMANPNSKGQHVDEICWLQLNGVNFTANGSTPLTFDLPDGSTMSFTVDVSNVGTSAGLKGTQAPTWSGSQFSGSTGYYTIYTPNTAALYTNNGSVANDTTVTLRDIHLFGPSGVESTNPFEMVVADGESTNSNEYLDFGVVSGGSPLNLVEWLGATAGNNLVYGAPGSSGVPATPASACTGMIDCIRMVGKSGTANAAVFSTTRTGSPFTVMGQVHTNASSLQGFAFGVRWGGVRLRKALPSGRLDSTDQFTYRVINVKGQEIINTSTTGAATGNYTYISGQATMPGNIITLKEEMAPGSKSTLQQYDRTIVCTNGNPGSATVLPSGSFDPANPPTVDLQQLGDRVDCTLTNIPRIADLKLVKSAPATVQAGQPLSYTLAISNNGTHTATGAVFTDTLPVGITGVTAGGVSCGSATNGAVCGALGVSVTGSDAAGYTVTGAIQSLPANGSVVVTINATAPVNITGAITNTATVKLASTDTTVGEPAASTADNTSSAQTTVQGTPALQVTKTATLGDTNGNGKADVGEVINYVITATNSGNVTLNGLTVSDPMAGSTALACSPTSIDPGKTANCGSFSYTVTQADVDAGAAIHNVATITGTPPGGGSPVTSTGTTDTPIGSVQIIAKNDTYNLPNGANGGSTGNVVGNDQLGTTTGPAIGTAKGQVTLAWGSVSNPPASGGFTLNADGTITVKPGTPAGTYKVPYTICEAAQPSNCATAEADVTVGAAAIAATPDSYTGIDGGAGQPNAGNALDNDTLNGVKATPGTVNLTVTSPASNPNVKLDPATGQVSVAPGTPAGTYTIGYQICEKLNPSNCATTTISVTVVAGKIAASNDSYTGIDGGTGQPNAGNVLDNDTLNGAAATPSTVNVTVTTPASNPNVKLDPATGQVSVAPGTPAGTYTIGYQICEKLNPTNCATATASVTVAAGKIAASNDGYTGINSSVGNTHVGNVLDNDTLNGTATTTATVTLSVTSPASNANVKLDPATGELSVAPGTPAGTYSIGYQICEKLNPSNCATAIATVTVAAGPITAGSDSYTGIDGSGNPSVGNALDNDTLNGAKATPATVTMTVTTPASNPNVKLDPSTGEVSVAPGTPAGTYTIGYRICDKINPSNCADTTISVTVAAGKIVATNDAYTGIDGGAGQPNAGNVLDNDTLDGVKTTPATVNLTVTTPASNPNVKLDPATGQVSVAPGTPAGTYTIGYQICEKLNPTNCATATASVTVIAGKIVATNDAYTGIDGGVGKASVGNVLDNDTLNGAKTTPSTVNLTVTAPASNPNVKVDPATGEVSVAPGTPAGTYTVGYQICEKLNPTNCATATASVTVAAGKIVATGDSYTGIDGGTGNPSVGNVLDNDTLNGSKVTPSTVTVTVTTPASNPNVKLDPSTGEVSVAPGTPAGTYTITYQICEKLNPSNCASATVSVTVDAGKIVATDDSYPGIDGGAGKPNAGNVLDNDTLDGTKATPATVNLTVTTPASNPNVKLDPASGQVSIAPGTPAGTYTIGYQICEKLNPANCKTATVTVTVVSLPLQAVNDDYRDTPINGATGGTPGKVLGNDTQGGVVIGDPSRVSTTLVDNGGLRGAAIGSDGSLIIPAGTARGTYTLSYRICDTLAPTNCSTASITLAVSDDALLQVSKQATPQTVKVGDVVRYSVTIQNPGKADVHQAVLADTPPVGFTLVAESLNVGTSGGRLAGNSPIRVEGIDVAAGKSVVVVYLMRVGPGASARGEYVNTAQMLLNGVRTSNVAQAKVQRDADPLFEDSRVFGTVFDDRNGDGWQASATAEGLHVQGGFAPEAYVPGSTTVDRGQGPQPEPDASAPLLHGIALGSLRGRDSVAQPEGLRRIVISQRLRSADFNSDFQLTSTGGTTLHLRADGRNDVTLSGDAAKGYSAEALRVERHVTPDVDGTLRVDYVITNRGIDERGIPGVRIGTVEGNLIETDAYGRFHLEGIDVPNMARGRNFIMKVDPATVPPGSEFTTPNPQVKRLTQGIPARFDFGVKLPEQTLPAPPSGPPPENAATRGAAQTGGQP